MSDEPTMPVPPTDDDAQGLRIRPDSPEPFVRAENQALQLGAVAEDWRELIRRRAELRLALRTAVTEGEGEQKSLAASVQALRDSLARMPEDESTPVPDAAAVRDLRQRLHEAGIQLALFERRRGQGGQRESAWQSLAFGELCRLGFAFFLPLIVALLLAAGIVAVGLERALGMP